MKQHICPTQQHNEIPATLNRHTKMSYGVPYSNIIHFLKDHDNNYSAKTVLCTVAAIFLSPKPGGTVPSQNLFLVDCGISNALNGTEDDAF